MTKGAVIRREYGLIDTATFDPKSWPDGQHYIDILTKEGFPPTASENANYWQAAGRWAMMTKYNVLLESKKAESNDTEKVDEEEDGGDSVLAKIGYDVIDGKRMLVLSEEAIKAIDTRWQVLVEQAKSISDNNSSNGEGESMPTELHEFLTTGKSNDRIMYWSVLDCPVGLQFALHAHPNIELVLCFRGDLHEVRMKGEPITTKFETTTTTKVTAEQEEVTEVICKGPNLANVSRPWFFKTVREGEWIVNEVGSIHKTFTASKGREGSEDVGCLLLVLWGGSKADVVKGEEPASPNVQDAVNQMDQKLCSCNKWEEIEETFLPESERSHKKQKLDE